MNQSKANGNFTINKKVSLVGHKMQRKPVLAIIVWETIMEQQSNANTPASSVETKAFKQD
jgi:hypothetical protein